MSWGYEPGTVMPDQWYTLFPVANGSRQSPVDLDEKLFQKQEDGKALELSYNNADITCVENNGHSVAFLAEGKNSMDQFNQNSVNPAKAVFKATPSVTTKRHDWRGGPLTEKHQLLQFHFHWGSEDCKGAEHTLNGKEFAAELHLVHLNTKYSSFAEALQNGDGLCVIGVFLTVVDNPNEGAYGFNQIAELIGNVKYKKQKHQFDGGFDILSILPQGMSKYTSYEGSLTTPPLSECVQWINVLEPVRISKQNMLAFRSLFSNEMQEGKSNKALSNNYRPPQPLKERSIHLCLC